MLSSIKCSFLIKFLVFNSRDSAEKRTPIETNLFHSPNATQEKTKTTITFRTNRLLSQNKVIKLNLCVNVRYVCPSIRLTFEAHHHNIIQNCGPHGWAWGPRWRWTSHLMHIEHRLCLMVGVLKSSEMMFPLQSSIQTTSTSNRTSKIPPCNWPKIKVWTFVRERERLNFIAAKPN